VVSCNFLLVFYSEVTLGLGGTAVEM